MLSTFAQQDSYTIKNKKAINFLQEARKLYQSRNNSEAKVYCQKALDKEEEFVEAILLMGYILLVEEDLDGAKARFVKASELNPNFFPGVFLELGALAFKRQKYEEAIGYLNTYINKYDPKGSSLQKAQNYKDGAQFAIDAMANPVPFEPINLGPGVNSEGKEYLGVVSTDQNMIVFTRTIKDQRSPNGLQEDFYVSFKMDNGEWSTARNMGAPLNSVVNEGGHSLTADGKAMVFTICEVFGNYGKGRYGAGSCDLFVSYRKGNSWTPPKNLGPGINSPFFDSQPSLSTDGKTLLFSSARKGGFGASDIYEVTISDGKFSRPKNLGPVINTAGREEGVFLHPDGKTMFFSSTGHPGMGKADIFMSKKQDNGTWSKPVNLGYPINTHKDEIDFTVDALGEYAYFTSDRDGGFGDWDIYKFELPQNLKPDPVTYMEGIVFDEKSKEPLGASFELIDLETKEVVVASNSSDESGEFLVCLPAGRNYALNVNKEGYLFYSENFTLTETKDLKPVHKDVPLKKFEVGKSIVLKNVFFDTDKFDLKSQSYAELDKLVQFLQNNPSLKVEIGGHTDNIGNSEDNQLLSKNRAKSVLQYLIQEGISASRLTFAGYAATEPIASNDTPEGRAQNRRTELKIIGTL